MEKPAFGAQLQHELELLVKIPFEVAVRVENWANMSFDLFLQEIGVEGTKNFSIMKINIQKLTNSNKKHRFLLCCGSRNDIYGWFTFLCFSFLYQRENPHVTSATLDRLHHSFYRCKGTSLFPNDLGIQCGFRKIFLSLMVKEYLT